MASWRPSGAPVRNRTEALAAPGCSAAHEMYRLDSNEEHLRSIRRYSPARRTRIRRPSDSISKLGKERGYAHLTHSAMRLSRACWPSAWRCRPGASMDTMEPKWTRQTPGAGLPEARPYSPYAEAQLPDRVYSGATPTCTPPTSIDAGAFGNRLGPADAYRFARGEEVVSSTGVPAKLSRPLDFLVVADHSENMGSLPDALCGRPRC